MGEKVEDATTATPTNNVHKAGSNKSVTKTFWDGLYVQYAKILEYIY